MVDGISKNNIVQSYNFEYTTEDVKKWAEDQTIINVVKDIFKRVKRDKAKDLLWYLIKAQRFKASDIGGGKSIIIHNMKSFNVNNEKNDGEIKLEELKRLREELLIRIQHIVTARTTFENGKEIEHEISDDEDNPTPMFDFDKCIVNKFVTFETIRKNICDEAGKLEFKYDFNEPDLPIISPKEVDTLQHVKIQILTQGVKFDYPLIYKYVCTECENITVKKAYEVTSTNNKILCPHNILGSNSKGEPTVKKCKHTLSPDKDLTVVKKAYFYEVGYEDEHTKFVASAISFEQYKPGFYECVMYLIPSSGKTETFFILDVQQIPPNKLPLPTVNPNENYVFTLQRTFDDYIKQQTGVEIYGLYPIKCGLILQTALHYLKERLLFNVMVVGDPSTGKSLSLKYYSFLLNNYYNLSTNGISVSIAGLRGTRSAISLFGKDIKIVTIGHLGSYNSIHIDEAGENKELVQNLKSFLLEDNYSYDRAGSTGVSNERTAHVNISQNLDHEHVGVYRGAIRKAYKELNMTIGGIEKSEWNENWDLFQPLHYYEDNPQLRKVIKDKRIEFHQKQIFFIDGVDLALHHRFPFYFFVVNEKENIKLLEAVRNNSSRKTVDKNLEVIRALYTEDIDLFFKSLQQYQYSPEDSNAYVIVDKIIKEYGLIFDVRNKNIYYMILRLSRVINQRINYTEEDYNLIRLFLESTNNKLDVADMDVYTIKGPPNIQQIQKQEKQIEETKSFDDSFGLPIGEF